MFIRRVNDQDYDLDNNYIDTLNYRLADSFESFQVMKHGANQQFVLRAYVTSNVFFSVYYGITPGSCIAAMQIIIDNWDEGVKVLDFTDDNIKGKLERADLDWAAQYHTYYDLPVDIREHITRESFDEIQNKIKMMSDE